MKEGDFRQHGAGLRAGRAIHVVVAEEDLRGGSAGSTVLRHVVRTDVDGGSRGLLRHLDGRGFRVGTGNGVALTFGGLNDQINAAVVGHRLVQLKGEGLALAHDGGKCEFWNKSFAKPVKFLKNMAKRAKIASLAILWGGG